MPRQREFVVDELQNFITSNPERKSQVKLEIRINRQTRHNLNGSKIKTRLYQLANSAVKSDVEL